MGWSIQLNHPESREYWRSEPPIRVVLEGSDWAEIKEVWANLLETNGITP